MMVKFECINCGGVVDVEVETATELNAAIQVALKSGKIVPDFTRRYTVTGCANCLYREEDEKPN